MDTVKKKKPKKKIITVKTSLKSIIRYEPLVEIIESASIETSKIINHSYQFLKLYFISLISKNKALPEIKKKLLRGIFKLFFSRTNQRKLDESEKEILSFYKKEYLPLISSEEKINSEKLSGILDYSAIAMETNIKNNIIAHYVDYVKRYINVIFEKKKFKEELDQLEMKKEDYTSQFSSFCKNLKNILSDVLFFDKNEIKSNLSPEEISSLREKVVPFQYLSGKAVDPEKNIIYFLKSKPLDFLPVSIKMMMEIEERGEKIYNVFCGSGYIPQYIALDTYVLLEILDAKKFPFKENKKTLRASLSGGEMAPKLKVWDGLFKIKENDKIFRIEKERKGFSFNFLIYTDGIGCSISLQKEDTSSKKKEEKKKEEEYIHSLSKEKLHHLKSKKIIAVDPNVQDIIFCVDEENQTFRYTRPQRKRETKVKKYRQIRTQIKKDCGIITIEEELSKYDFKTLNFERYKSLLKIKNEKAVLMRECYSLPVFRQLKFNTYANTRRSEDKMLNNFKKRFKIENEKDVVIGFGDFELSRGMKFQPPTKGKGMRRLFSKRGYNTFLVDEFRTSKRCSHCCNESECFPFLKRKSPRPWRTEEVLVHGLLKCKACMRLWNRDLNAARNIFKIVDSTIKTEERPPFLRREKLQKNSDTVNGHPPES